MPNSFKYIKWDRYLVRSFDLCHMWFDANEPELTDVEFSFESVQEVP